MHSILLTLCVLFQESTLNHVLTRAANYVSRYEAELGNLIGTEEYVQNAAWLNLPQGVASRKGKMPKSSEMKELSTSGR